ncbi:MAG: T9SS type A sorting domain-containing protein [Prevotella sp.]|nr:T9SS type A sorting domain-containing protein [Prevotella sp.]
MKKRLTIICLMWMALIPLWAANTVTTVEQVTSAVTLSDNVDYHITSTTPFAVTGSIDIANEKAVVILDNVKPSQAGLWLPYIKLNGTQISNGNNCQIRIYDCGSIILPYGNNVKALTVFSERNFQGDSCDDFNTDNSGGYMNTLTTEQLNNRIMSFKLKRGYMVTFALRAGGYGYSRCFIADKGDLEMNLPLLMAHRISSYRLFKWQDIGKRGYAGTDNTVNSLLNTTWFYGWDASSGNQYADREYVPQHHHEGWPSIEDVGRNGNSAHALGNNEPDNTGDEREKVNSVDEVLNNWEKMMATGKRLGSPAMSGNKTWISQFFDSIDARVWRCDFIAVHDYNLNDRGSKIWNVNDYKNCANGRPVWLTEMNYGANWTEWPGSNRDGNAANYQIELNHFGPTIDGYNETDYVERYAFYNWVQDCRKAYNDGDASLADKRYLTPMGEYYAAVKPGLAYNSAYDIVPTNPRTYNPVITSSSFQPASQKFIMKWEEKNGDLADSVVIERRDAANAEWKAVYVYPQTEKAASYTFTEIIEHAGYYTYRVAEHMYNNRVLYSEEVYNVVAGADGTDVLQYGTLSSESTDPVSIFMKTAFDENPAIVTGGTTNKNTTLTPVENIATINKNGFFTFKYFPFTLTSANQTFNSAENTSYLIAKTGHGTIGTLAYEAGPITNSNGRAQRISTDVVSVTFKEPFATTPVVMASPYQNTFSYPVTCRVFDITNEGFKILLQRQEGITESIKPSATCSYFAIEQGQTEDENNKLITVGTADYSTPALARNVTINYNGEEELENPFLLAQLQSLNNNFMTLVRISSVRTKSAVLRLQADGTASGTTFSTSKPYQETMAYLVISDGKGTNGIRNINVQQAKAALTVFGNPADNAIGVNDPTATAVTVYSTSGQKLMSQPLTEGQATLNISTLPTGVYILRSNANHSTKIVKK